MEKSYEDLKIKIDIQKGEITIDGSLTDIPKASEKIFNILSRIKSNYDETKVANVLKGEVRKLFRYLDLKSNYKLFQSDNVIISQIELRIKSNLNLK